MNDLLTAAEYAAIAKMMSFPENAFINGCFRPATSGKTFDTVNPATGEVLAKVAACDAADVDFAAAKAKESVTTFNNLSEAISLANDTPYGLAASVYTGSLRKAIKLSRDIRAGTVTVNCFGEGDATTPFGGYKESGFGGRDKSIFAHDQYTELKTIWIDVSDRSIDETVR
jgi:acyl-CoA reductase-like NAD-dependent aldehyde dehydrogenase